MKKTILAAMLVATSVPAMAAQDQVPDEAFRAKVETLVRSQLKDPQSAIFTHVLYDPTSVDKHGVVRYCGLVNAKNSYGGYAGDTPFMVFIERDGSMSAKISAGFVYGCPNVGLSLSKTVEE